MEPTRQESRLAAEAMAQSANAPTSSMAAAEQVATRPAQKPTGQRPHGDTTTLQHAVLPAAAEHWDHHATAEDVATQPTPAEQRPTQDEIADFER